MGVAMSRSFTVKYSGKRCPGCRKAVEIGQEGQFQSIEWPYGDPIYTNPRDLKVWHSVCVNQALVDGLCEACGMLHKDKGMCLI